MLESLKMIWDMASGTLTLLKAFPRGIDNWAVKATEEDIRSKVLYCIVHKAAAHFTPKKYNIKL
jgi:hypothetical protein